MAGVRQPIILVKCRTCLGEFNENDMHALFEEDGNGETVSTEKNTVDHTEKQGLSSKVEFCCGIKVQASAHLPTKICECCYEFVRMWYSFRQMCLNSQVYLESSCLDEDRPDELIDASDHEYMEYLYATLQHTNHSSITDTIYEAGPDDSEVIIESQYNEEVELGEESNLVKTKQTKSEEMLYVMECDEVIVPNDIDENTQSAEIDRTTDKCDDTVNYYSVQDDDVLSSVPSPGSQSSMGKRKPGRPRKPDHELKSKRKLKPGDTSQSAQFAESLNQFICNLCGNVYHKKSAFKAHMSVHTDHKPHQCEICFKSFRQMGELRAHIRRHTGERPYKCLYCERHFYDRSEKIRHERVHTNTRPYACKVCGKTFTHTAILKNHSLVHSGEKNYSCSVCSKSFTLLHQLKAHLQTFTHKNRAEQALASVEYTSEDN